METIELQGQPVQIIVAQTTDLLTAHVNRFRLRFTVITLALFILLMTAQRWIIRRSLQPLEALQADCKAPRNGSPFPDFRKTFLAKSNLWQLKSIA